ncbi:MAG TPA: aminodeoxychorismate lyase [Steroidobacteraceae bacterium]
MNAGASPAGAPRAVLVNGLPGQSLPVTDRALHYGDGLFETLTCVGGRPRFLEQHLARLAAGCARLGIALAADAAHLRAELLQLAAQAPRALLKLIVTRGVAVARGYAIAGTETPNRIVLRYDWPAEPAARAREGVRVRIANLRLGENPALAGLKHLNRLEQVLARAEWSDPEIFESLLLSSSGPLISGTMSNVFTVSEGVLMTPKLERCGIAGVMRGCVLRAAARAGISAQEVTLSLQQLAAAQEVFLTNVRIGVVPVRAIEQRELLVGPVTQRLQSLLAALPDDGSGST